MSCYSFILAYVLFVSVYFLAWPLFAVQYLVSVCFPQKKTRLYVYSSNKENVAKHNGALDNTIAVFLICFNTRNVNKKFCPTHTPLYVPIT